MRTISPSRNAAVVEIDGWLLVEVLAQFDRARCGYPSFQVVFLWNVQFLDPGRPGSYTQKLPNYIGIFKCS